MERCGCIYHHSTTTFEVENKYSLSYANFIVILTTINAFFAASEMAIVSINTTRLRVLIDEGSRKAVLLQKLMSEPTKFLSTIQAGITFAAFSPAPMLQQVFLATSACY